MKLSMGPIQYFWPRQQVLDFYRQIEGSPVDIVYLGETVCSKRKQMRTADWFELADRLAAAGKEVVMSTLALSESESDMKTLRRICENEKYLVEANDMSAVSLLEGRPFITGYSVNIYNHHSLHMLSKLGLQRWVMPLELSKDTLSDLQQNKPHDLQTEVFAFGRMPLAYSARCYTARAHNLQKDNCEFRCIDYPDGMLLKTQEDEKFLCLNGIQTQSARTFQLFDQLNLLEQLDVDVIRLSPQMHNMQNIIQHFACAINDSVDSHDVSRIVAQYASHGLCNGYWNGEAGLINFQSDH